MKVAWKIVLGFSKFIVWCIAGHRYDVSFSPDMKSGTVVWARGSGYAALSVARQIDPPNGTMIYVKRRSGKGRQSVHMVKRGWFTLHGVVCVG